MCGITGIYQWQGKLMRQKIVRMTEKLKHRGPDDEGYYFNSNLGLGFRRLSIIDLKTGNQPLYNESGDIHLIFNGEIYNYLELREELLKRGHHFRTKSDSEVILHLYEEEGQDLFIRLRGMFAIVIWDEKKGKLILGRDRFGIKPLYYHHGSDFFAFSSEIKALMSLEGLSGDISKEALWHYLSLQYVPEPYTMFREIKKLPPGQLIILDKDGIELKSYWEVKFHTEKEKRDKEYWVERALEILSDSVKVHSQSDVPLGAFLSGGIDSAVIAALLRQQGRLKTFTVGFPEQGYNEFAPASLVARFLETEHYQVMVTPAQFQEKLPHLVWHLDEPLADPSAISLYFVAQLASRYVKVVLSGEGADEIFGGYNIYREPYSLSFLKILPNFILKRLAGLAMSLPSIKGSNYIKRAVTPLEERYIGNANIFSEETKAELLLMDDHQQSTTDLFAPLYKEVKGRHDLDRMQYIDLKTWLPGDILMKADKMTMANFLELRVPFLDQRVFEFAAQIPLCYKVYRGQTKYILRQAAEKILPLEVTRRKKLGFPTPIRIWLRKELLPMAKELLHSQIASSFFDRKRLESMLDIHLSRRKDYSRELWTIMIFVLWHEQYY